MSMSTPSDIEEPVHVYLDRPYKCPMCDRPSGPTYPDRCQVEYFVWRRIWNEPICEVCWRELPYALMESPTSSLRFYVHLVRRLSMLTQISEYDLQRNFIRGEIARLTDPAYFRAYVAAQREGHRRARRKPTRRILKKRWKRQLFETRSALTALEKLDPDCGWT